MMQAIVTEPLPFTDIRFLFMSHGQKNYPQHQTTEVERSSAGTIAQQQFSILQGSEARIPRRFADPANLVGDVGHFKVFL